MDIQKLKTEKFSNSKRLEEIEKLLNTCRLNHFGKTHWKRKAKRDRLICEKIELQERQNYIKKLIKSALK